MELIFLPQGTLSACSAVEEFENGFEKSALVG
jgi:hypothetical protein